MASTKSFCTWRRTLSNSCAPSNSVNAPVREPRLRSHPPVMSAPNSVPATITARARADALGSLSFMLYLTLDAAKRLRERGCQGGDDSLMHGRLVSCAIYQLDRSTFRMGVLPLWIRELTEGVSHLLVKIVARPFYPVALAPRVCSIESVRGVDIEEECEIGNKAAGCEPVGGADFGLGQPAPDDLICVCRQEEPVDQHSIQFFQRWKYFPRDQLGARCHEQQPLGRRSELFILMKHNVTDFISYRRAPWLPPPYGQNPGVARPRASGGISGRCLGLFEHRVQLLLHLGSRVLPALDQLLSLATEFLHLLEQR